MQFLSNRCGVRPLRKRAENYMKGMDEMMKRKKDGGFTLIELMIVIAVIGILAVVLVPKVGSIKTSAKQSGLDVNMRIVQGYCVSQIDKWSEDSGTFTQTKVATEIMGVVTTGSNSMTNPSDNLTATAFTIQNDGKLLAADTDPKKGIVYISSVTGSNSTYKVKISSIDNAGGVYKTIDITP